MIDKAKFNSKIESNRMNNFIKIRGNYGGEKLWLKWVRQLAQRQIGHQKVLFNNYLNKGEYGFQLCIFLKQAKK